MIIDAHNHPDWHGHDLTRFLRNMDAYGIDRTWLLTWECPASEYDPNGYAKVLSPAGHGAGPMGFASVLRYVERAPDRFIPSYAPDPRRPEAIDLLAAAIDLHDVRIYGELKLRMMYDDLDALRMFRFCGERGLPVIVHIDYEFPTGRRYPRPNWWYGGGIEPFERAVRACPGTTFLGHAPGFWSHISGDDQFDKVPYPKGPVLPGGRLVKLLRDCPNLYCDLSAGSAYTALSRDPAFARDFLLEFQDRALYARDYFDNRMQDFLRSLELPAEALAKVLAGNALRLVPDRPRPAWQPGT